MESRSLTLPARFQLTKPDPDDPVDYYYRPLTARLYRARLRLALDALGKERFETLLEVGYGSGIFVPELSRHCNHIAAIDLHGQADRISAMLSDLGIDADLRQASLFQMPFADGSFDALVCLSVLEHLRELDAALSSLRRILNDDGVAILGFPVRNALTDRFFRLVGYDPRAIHPSSHNDILAAARRSGGFMIDRVAHMPSFLPVSMSAYVVCRLRAVWQVRAASPLPELRPAD
ncbi:MAG: class I SAM-dependent methyltransferase [Gaiellaceae bacterium]